MSSEAVNLRTHGGDHAIAVWRNVVIVVFAATPVAAVAERMKGVVADVAREHPQGVGMLHVVDARSGPPPDQDARAQYVEMIRTHDDRFIAAAIVATGSGFVPSMVRSVTAGFALLTRPSFPMKTFSTVPDGASWLAAHMSLDPTDLQRAYEQTRDALGSLANPL